MVTFRAKLTIKVRVKVRLGGVSGLVDHTLMLQAASLYSEDNTHNNKSIQQQQQIRKPVFLKHLPWSYRTFSRSCTLPWVLETVTV